MNDSTDELDDLERLLRAAPLRPASASLDQRVTSACRPRRWTPARLTAIAAMMAAAVGAPFILHRAPPTRRPSIPPVEAIATKPSTQPLAKPVTFSQSHRTVTDDGMVGTVAGEPVRRISRHTVQQLVVIDPETGRRVAITVPREEILVVRVQPF